ncbi:hypothetical protein DFJ73DRAFT_660739 [Zopfochytrium polystomum]|nr:hypothetical protein DFJ73DRAFT_660739 [Zopfochytrium polystomum]
MIITALYSAVANGLAFLKSLVGIVPRYNVPKQGDAVFITGASTGIGNDAALFLASKGFTVFAGVRNAADGEALVAQFERPPPTRGSGEIIPVLADVTDETALVAARDTISDYCDRHGKRFAALVNNAGISFPFTPLELTEDKEVLRLFEVNVFGAIRATRICLPLVRKFQGRVIFVSSTSALLPVSGFTAYSATKSAVESIVAGLRIEMLSFKVPVISILPGPTKSTIWSKSVETLRAADRRNPGSHSDEGVYQSDLARFEKRALELARRAEDPRLSTSPAILKAITSSTPRLRYIVGDLDLAIQVVRRIIGERNLIRILGTV